MYDEALTVYIARQPVPDALSMLLSHREPGLPLIHFLLTPLTCFSSSEIVLRIPSLIFGVALVYLMYLLGEKVFSRSVGLVSALLVACSEPLIYQSVEIRFYSALCLFSAWSVLLFIDNLNARLQRIPLRWVVVTALCAYTHYLGLFVFLSECLAILLLKENRKDFKVWLRHFIGPVIFLLIPEMIWAFMKFSNFGQWTYYTSHPHRTMTTLSFWVDFLAGHRVLLCAFFLVVGYAFLSGKVRTVAGRLREGHDAALFSALYFVPPLVLAYLMQLLFGVHLLPQVRYFLPLLVSVALVVGWGMVRCSKMRIGAFVVALVLAMVVVNGVRYGVSLRFKPRLPLKETENFLIQNVQPGDVIAITDLYSLLPVINNLNKPLKIMATPKQMENQYILRTFGAVPSEIVTDRESLKPYRRMWIVTRAHEHFQRPAWLADLGEFQIQGGGGAQVVRVLLSQIVTEDNPS